MEKTASEIAMVKKNVRLQEWERQIEEQSKEECPAAGVGTTDRRTEIERSERSGVVSTTQHKTQNILLPSAQGKRRVSEVRQI